MIYNNSWRVKFSYLRWVRWTIKCQVLSVTVGEIERENERVRKRWWKRGGDEKERRREKNENEKWWECEKIKKIVSKSIIKNKVLMRKWVREEKRVHKENEKNKIEKFKKIIKKFKTDNFSNFLFDSKKNFLLKSIRFFFLDDKIFDKFLFRSVKFIFWICSSSWSWSWSWTSIW